VTKIVSKLRLMILIGCICLVNTSFSADFSFIDLDGESRKLSDYQGKWVLVNFWATWCPPCRKEIPDLSDFHLETEDAVVIGVNFEPGLSDEKLDKFVAVYLMSYPVTRVNDEIIEVLGQPKGLPTSVLIDPNGNIVKTIAGLVTTESLNKVISQFELSARQ
jgi:thiol-disulfide isomerase/thioredoxin